MARKKALRLLFLAVGVAALLIARARQRSTSSTHATAAAAWADVPSVPEWYAPIVLPITRYDEMPAAEIAKAVRRLDEPDEVQQVLDYEETHDQRVTVFRAAKSRLRALQASDPVAAQ